jgi:hypothetical protein
VDDIVVVALVNPPTGSIDNVGDAINLEVILENKSLDKTYSSVVLNAVISDGKSSNIEFSETITNFAPSEGIPINYKFTSIYTVPLVQNYTIKVFINSVDNYPYNDTTEVRRQTNIEDDIAVVDLVNPAGSVDNVGSPIHLEVTLENHSPTKIYDVILNALISDGVNPNMWLTESVTNFGQGTKSCTFTHVYTVPAVSNYTIRIFVNSVDYNPSNDTITKIRQTNLGINDCCNTGTGFSLGQNIPNPAKDNTRIEYSIPTDGQVIFTVYSITGQTLHIEKRDAYSGRNNIEFSTSNLANGIYYYSMEYNGERLVKKMTIRLP